MSNVSVSISTSEISPGNSTVVRKASRSNAEDALLLIEEYYEEIGVVLRDSRETLLRYIDDPKSGIWIAHVGSSPAGCVVLHPCKEIPNSGEVKRLYVRREFRGRGLAHALMQSLEDDARKMETKWLYLDSKDDLKNAIRFYERHGYERCDRYNNNPQATIFMQKPLHGKEFFIRTFQPGDEPAFRALNEAWITAYFFIESEDHEILDNPVKSILEPGGQIFFAIRGEQAVGCCALLPMKDGSFEVSKMAVAEQERGNGIGKRILQAVIDHARERRIPRLYLETNNRLKPAIHLYESLGFRHPEDIRTRSPYGRADIFMDMHLR